MKSSTFMVAAWQILERAKQGGLTEERRQAAAVELAGFMLNEAREIQTGREKVVREQLARMLNDPAGKVFLTSMTDQCFRSSSHFRVADQLVYLIKKYGIPKFLSPIKRLGFLGLRWLGRPFAWVLVPLVRRMLQRETSNVILPGEPKQLFKHLQARRNEGVHINLNHLGEAILGEEEAHRRLGVYLKDLENPEIECISIKISTIYSQINLLSREATIQELSVRLKRLYRAAKTNFFILPDGRAVAKFVNLDMEEYRDLHLTVELFKRVLDEDEFLYFSAGIVLQSYLPDSFFIQKELTEWARKRMEKGGAPIKIRIVKGANLAMERVEASLREWPQAPYRTKGDVDANFKRMVKFGCQQENARAVNLGIGSHNLFDIAYTLLLRSENHVEKEVCFEMLEGMADNQRRVVQALSDWMLLYCPAAAQEEFQNAVAYLVRRLDENTAPENFLRYAFDMIPGSKEWKEQAGVFVKACKEMDSVQHLPFRTQNRLQEIYQSNVDGAFENESDTDWSLVQNGLWAKKILEEWSKKEFPVIPLVIGHVTVAKGVAMAEGVDPSFPEKILYRYALGGEKELELALNTAEKGFISWQKRPLKQRLSLLAAAAQGLRKGRGNLIGAMVADTGKTIAEADVEISEAIDFVEYYRRNAEEVHSITDIEWRAKGPVLVAPPWNFPCSIPVGGIAAALTAGNSVIFKPAPEAVLVGWEVAKIFCEAGIEQDVLQFFCCADDPIGSLLVKDQRLKAVILTGGTSTAKHFMQLRPGIDLMAETGGKNAMIITRMSDRDLAIKDLVQSAFGHAGQKCSACSLAILEKEVYDDPHFRMQLRDAVASMRVGSPWDPAVRVNPLIRQPEDALWRGLTSLDEGEEWLLKPVQDQHNPQLWSPGIKFGVKPNSFMHQTELFGPVLGVMCAKNLDEAIAVVNATKYGLTSGIHTLDEREQNRWLEGIVAGNCYINRGITGAIVQRQPFGGCKESGFGPGAKAGGPNYLMQLMVPVQKELPRKREAENDVVKAFCQRIEKQLQESDEKELWRASIGSYAFYWNHYFSKEHDPSKVCGQDNVLRYVPHMQQVLRVQQIDRPVDVWRVMAAALTCGAEIEVSVEPGLEEQYRGIKQLKVTEESEDQVINRLGKGEIKRLRLLSKGSGNLMRALAQAASNGIVAPVMANGRIELLHLLREVSISKDYHRYGYLGEREPEGLGVWKIRL